MMPTLTKRRRVEAQVGNQGLYPFLRAQTVEDCSIYWMPVASFPAPHLQREWMLEFLRRLAGRLKETQQLREEWFLQFKTLYPNLLNLFIERSPQYVPMTGITLSPGAAPVKPPSFAEAKSAVEDGSKKGEPIDVHRWMPDHTHWFAMKHPEEQRNDFFGHGGMFALYLAPDDSAASTLPPLPRFITSHPAYTPDVERQHATVQSLKDGFLVKSKQLFGQPFQEDPGYRGLTFVLPLLTSHALVDADPSLREQWFSLFDACVTESVTDKGLLLALKDPAFDDPLMQLLQEMRDDKMEYFT